MALNFEVALSDLLPALQLVSPAMNATAPDLTGYFVFRQTSPEVMEVLTHESFTQAKGSFAVKVISGEGSFTVPGKALLSVLEVLKDENLEEIICFTFDGATTTVSPQSAPNRKFPFDCRDPQFYKYFDKNLKDAKVLATLEADRLRTALASAKGFASTEDTVKPALTVCELREGVLQASNQKMLLRVTLDGVPSDACLRVQLKQHFGAVMAFLSASKGLNVEIMYLENRQFFLRQEGTENVLGWTYYDYPFPVINPPADKDAIVWTLNSRALRNGLKALLAGVYLNPTAKDKVTPIKFSRVGAGPITMSSMIGTRSSEWVLPVISTVDTRDETEQMTEVTFSVVPEHLTSLLQGTDGDDIAMGVNTNTRKGTGYIRVGESRVFGDKTDEYRAMLVWYREQ